MGVSLATGLERQATEEAADQINSPLGARHDEHDGDGQARRPSDVGCFDLDTDLLGRLLIEKEWSVMPTVVLRLVNESDLDAIFEQMRDPVSVRMAAFTTEDPNDRAAFDAHMSKIMTSPDVTVRAVTCDERLVGTIGRFVLEGVTEVTYWLDRSYWGKGIATSALQLLLEDVPVRPVRARVASDNVGSLRVLQKVGFQTVGTEVSYAPAREAEIEETIPRIDLTPHQGVPDHRRRDARPGGT